MVRGLVLAVSAKGAFQKSGGGIPMTSSGKNFIRAKNESMEKFAELLSGQFQAPVEDRTALEDVFDFKLEWAPDEISAAVPAGLNNPQAMAGSSSDPVSPTSGALTDQLGLKLRAQKVQVQVVVVDHAEKIPKEK
jgi:uncharacterized protein (TIGR03435 family)